MKKRRWKKALAILLAVVMVLGMIPDVGTVNVSAEEHSHAYDEDGFCSCGAYEPAELTTDKYDINDDDVNDSVYEIGNAGQLYWFAGLVNGDASICTGDITQNTSANAVLTADITVNTGVLDDNGELVSDVSNFRTWTPIGSGDNRYTGTFDGQVHTISGLYFNDPTTDEVGFFGYVGSGGSVSNLGIVESYFYGDQSVGAVCGESKGNITNCYNTGTVKGASNFTGGICGYLDFPAETISITNCYNTGKVSGLDAVGGVCGKTWYTNITNCYNAAEVSGSSDVGGVCGVNEYGTITNCYYEIMDGISGGIAGADAEGQAEGKTTDKFTEGEVAYLLQGEQEEAVWGQTLSGTGKQDYPVIGGIPVYYREDGYTNTYGSLNEGTQTITASRSPYVWYEFTPEASGTYLFVAPADQAYVREDISVAATGSPCYTKELVEGTKYYVCIPCALTPQADLTIKKFETSDTQLKVDENTVYITHPSATWYEFTPASDGNYKFSSTKIYGSIYVNTEKTMNDMQSMSSSPIYSLSAETTYYVYLNYGPGEYDLTIEKLNSTFGLGDNEIMVPTSGKLWYEFTPTETGTYQFSSTKLTAGALYVVTDKNDTSSTYIQYSPAYELNAETTYYVSVNYTSGSYDLKIKKLDTTLEVATNEFEVSLPLIWYEFTPTETGTYQFSSTGLTGGGGNLYVNTTKTEDAYEDITSSPTYELTAGTTYYVAVSYQPGSYDLKIEKDTTFELEVGTNTITTSTSDKIWYEFTPAETGIYRFSSTTIYGGWLYVNTDKSTTDSKILMGTSNILSYELNAGTTYYVAVKLTDGTYDLKIERIQYDVTLTSSVAGGSESESVVTLTGGGKYDSLSEVTVSAPEKEGFTFAGWYEEGYTEESEPVCSTLTYTFVINANTSLVAVYNANASIVLNVSGDSNSYSVNGTTQASNSYTESFKAGTSITVKYTGSNTFCYWKNDSGKIVSRSQEYTFALVSATTLTAVAVGESSGSEETGYSALIEFVSYYGQVMQATTWGSNEDPSSKTLPVAPSKLGGTFKYWSIDGENEATAATIIDAIDGSATRITVKPVYEESTTTYTVTIKYPAELGKEDKVYNSQKLGDTLTLTADAVEGKVFAYWAGDAAGTEKLSYNESYFIIISGNVVLYPIYADAETEAEPVISVTNVYTSIVDGKNKVSFEITRSVPDTYEVVETGVLGIIDGTYNESSDMTISSSTAKKAVSSSTSNNGIYIMNINVTGRLDTTLAVRGYMIVKNKATGNTSVIYTDVKTATYNTAQ